MQSKDMCSWTVISGNQSEREMPLSKCISLQTSGNCVLMRTWSSLTVCWAGFHSWQHAERRRYWRSDWDVDPASLHVNYTQWDRNHSWSLSKGEPQCGGQTQRPWSQRLPRKTKSALITFPCSLQLPKRSTVTFTDHPVGFPFLPSYWHFTGGKKSSFQPSLSQAIPRSNFYHFSISRQKQIRETEGQVELCLIDIFLFF